MKGVYLILLLSLLVISFSALPKTAPADNDFNSDFTNASQMRGQESVKGTDFLVKNTTEVLHKENMATLAEIAKLHKEIADLKKDIKELKDLVEGGK